MEFERVVAVYIINKKGQVCLLYHKKFNVWLPPGGKVEPSELIHEAAIREVSEETGLEVEFIYDSVIPFYKEDGMKKLDNRSQVLPQPMLIQLDNTGKYYLEDFVYLAITQDDVINNKENNVISWFYIEDAVNLDVYEHVKKHLKYIKSKLNIKHTPPNYQTVQ